MVLKTKQTLSAYGLVSREMILSAKPKHHPSFYWIYKQLCLDIQTGLSAKTIINMHTTTQACQSKYLTMKNVCVVCIAMLL